mmetsp:Transcript_35978/g.35585  ORF Transcript_35978/g.35585 Transcript_35978/m.35585 type:complete len:215 (-) Transcript_35978:155-799(-)
MVNHPFVVRFESFSQDDKCIYFVQEFIRGGEFLTYLKQNTVLDLTCTRFYAAQIVMTLHYLHSQGILYRDLKPENLLLDHTGYLKFIDFGLSKKLPKERNCFGKTKTACGTPDYMAPEVLDRTGYGLEADWWSFGIILYEMQVGVPPFTGSSQMEIFENIKYGEVSFPRGLDMEVMKLIVSLLRKDPKKRKCKAKKVMKHKFFQDFDFNSLVFK